jgi:hypothetical protein
MYIYCSDICTSSSLPPGGAVEPYAEADVEVGGGDALGYRLEVRLNRRALENTEVDRRAAALAASCTARGPKMTIEVLH